MKRELKDAVREHVEARSLSEGQLAELEAMLAPEPQLEQPQRRPHVRWIAALAVSAVVCVSLWASWPDADVPTRIAHEVAVNHLKLKPLEVEATKVAGATEFFALHDVALLERSRILDAKPWSLTGGRHCSIQGEDAAQLRYTHAHTGDTVSVYMAAYDASALGPLPDVGAGEPPLKRQVRGMDVMMWVEEGVLVVATSVD